MRTVRGATGATYADSLALYNNALQSQAFYDSKAPYYNPVGTQDLDSFLTNQIESGQISRETLKTLQDAFLSGGSLSRQEFDEYMQDPQLRTAPFVQAQDKVFQIQDNTNPDIQLISDLVTGAIDPGAPLVAYDRRIEPQGVRTYTRKDPWDDLSSEIDGSLYYRDTLHNANQLFQSAIRANKSVNSFDDMADSLTLNYVSGDGNKPTGESTVIKKEDYIPVLNEIKDSTGLSEEELIDKILATGDLYLNAIINTPGNSTKIPYYDPVMVKPYKDLTPSEQQERIQKAIDSGNTGGLPPSVVAEVEKTIQSSSPQIQKTKQPMQPQPPADMQPMRSIPASQIEQVIGQGLMPSRGMGVGPTRSPRPIMRQDPTVSRGQYQVGELYWDDSRKKWQRDMWDKDERKQSRKEAKPRQERWRTIKTPKF
jgi:hypothetical protein